MSKRGKEQVTRPNCGEKECAIQFDASHPHHILPPMHGIEPGDLRFMGTAERVYGFGLKHGSKGWLAVRVSNLGSVEVLTPQRHGIDEGVSKPLALQQMQAASREHVLRLK